MKILIYLSFIAGMGMLFWSFYLHQTKQEFLSEAIVTKGIVINIYSNQFSVADDDYETRYTPEVIFETETGKLVKFISSIHTTDETEYSEEDVLDVIYPKSNPEEAKIDNSVARIGYAPVVAALGVVFSLLALFFRYLHVSGFTNH